MKKALVGVAGLAAIVFGIFWVGSNPPPSPPSRTTPPVDVAANVEAPVADTVPAAVETTTAPNGPAPVEAIGATLHEGGIISGRVLDAASGEGIPGVTVTTTWNSGGDTSADKEDSSVSGADGAYRLDNLTGAAGTRYELTRDTPEGYRRPTYMETRAIILDESGREFRIRRERGQDGYRGAFTLENLEDGDYQVDVSPKDGYQYMSLGGVLAGTKDLAIVLPGYFQVTGRVLDARTGQPIPEFEIVLQVNWSDSLDSWMAKQFQTVSNPAGRFELQQVQLYRSMLAARAPGYATGTKILDLTGPPYEHEVELKLEPGQELKGKVVDGRGAPIAGASIFWGRIQALGDRAITQSAEDGSFELPSFPAVPQMLSAYHPSYAPTWITVEGAARFRPVEIVLSDGGAIEGTVAFAGETALACAASIEFADYHFVPEMNAIAVADGTFHIERVRPGQATVVLTTGSDLPWQERLRYTQTVSVQAGGTTAVHFDIQPYTGGLEGVLQYPPEALPSRIQLTLESATDNGTVKRGALVAADGRFYFDRMPAGPATLAIDAGFQNHRRIATTIDVEVPDGDIGYVQIPL